jgi:anti-sigma B factor antagonist
MTATLEHCGCCSVVEVGGTLRAPLTSDLRERIQALLGRGERRILLDLSRVSQIDAAGVGELVGAFTTARAAGGVLQIACASRRVRQLLQVAGVLPLLTGRREG